MLVEFCSGMDCCMIDWKVSVCYGGLIVKEYWIECNNDIVFVIDLGRLMCELVEGVLCIDCVILVVLIVVFVVLKLGDKVLLFGFDVWFWISSGVVLGIGLFGMF